MSMILAAMPAHNEDERIAKVVLDAKKHVDKVVVVDDGSTDSTAEIAEALGAMVVRHCHKNLLCFETANNFFSKEKTLTKREGANQGCLTKEEAIKLLNKLKASEFRIHPNIIDSAIDSLEG